ncbi:hypothetical protein KIN08_09050, partial [Vibrio cholerae]
CGKLIQSENTTIISKKSSYSNEIKKVIHKINTLWNKLVHNTIYCVKVRKEFVDIKNKKKYLSTRKYRICEKVCE